MAELCYWCSTNVDISGSYSTYHSFQAKYSSKELTIISELIT